MRVSGIYQWDGNCNPSPGLNAKPETRKPDEGVVTYPYVSIRVHTYPYVHTYPFLYVHMIIHTYDQAIFGRRSVCGLRCTV
jgi:hypothetical protein